MKLIRRSVAMLDFGAFSIIRLMDILGMITWLPRELYEISRENFCAMFPP